MPETDPISASNTSAVDPSARSNQPVAIIKWLCVLAIIGSLFFIMQQLPIDNLIGKMRGWIESFGVWAPIVFGLIYIVAVLLLIPGSVLTIAAGGIFGLWLGTLVVSIASTTAAALALLIARYLARHRVEEWAKQSEKFRAMDNAIQEGGWKIVALLRLSPAVPFTLQNYFYGLTSIGFWRCVLTSWITMLPGTFMYVFVGHAGTTSLSDAGLSTEGAIFMAVGLAATVAVTVYITKLARRQLKKQTDVESEQDAKTAGESDQSQQGKPTVGTSILAAAALLAIASAVASPFILGKFFPPTVTLKEVYARNTDGATFDHNLLNEVLQTHVNDEGYVDYQALKANPQKLDAYLKKMADADFASLDRDEKLALLINAYNACTLKLIIEHYPLESIRHIPEDKSWHDQRWRIGKLNLSLWQIENEYLRPKFIEPRIHFAINCASVSCPKLQRTAYTGAQIETQLAAATRGAHVDGSRWFRFDRATNTAHVLEIYQWYKGDFEQTAGSIVQYLAQHVPAMQASIDRGDRPTVRYMTYNWSLNDQARP